MHFPPAHGENIMKLKLLSVACLFAAFAGSAAYGLDCAPCQPDVCGHPASSPAAAHTLPSDWQTLTYRQLMADIPSDKWDKYKVAFLDDPVPCVITVSPPRGLFGPDRRKIYQGYAGFVAVRSHGWIKRKPSWYKLYIIDGQGRLQGEFAHDWNDISTSPKLFDFTLEFQMGADFKTGFAEVLRPYMSEQSLEKVRRLDRAKFEELPEMM